MKLSQIVSSYRQEHGFSMDVFAKKCGVSKSYISMLENNVNPQSGKPVVPTIVTLKKLAKGMDMDLDALISIIDDQPVDISPISNLTFEEGLLLKKFRLLNSSGKEKVLDYISLLANSDAHSKNTESSAV